MSNAAADYLKALEVAPYDDDALVARHTATAMESGMRHLQVHRLHTDDDEHSRKLLELMMPPLLARVLDVGCGIGVAAACMSKLRPDLRFSLLNISRAQLELCPIRHARIKGDFHDIPSPDGSFDVAMMLYSMGHALLPTLMPELARILTKNGILFIWDITIEGPADIIREVGYKPHSITEVLAAADAAGFMMDRFEVPSVTDVSQFADLCGHEAYDRLFTHCAPVMYRFIKR